MTKPNFKQSQKNDKFRGIFPLEFDEKKGADEPAIPEKIHLVPIGQWEHDLYGPIIINSADIREFIQNFNAGVRKGVFITAGHEGFEELPAVGWIKELESRDDGLWGNVDWNNNGLNALKEKEFKFFSPEMCRDYEDPQTHQYFRNVLTGGALTKSPYFKELKAIVFSDKNIKNNFKEKDTMAKSLEDVLKIEVSALTAEDKAVLEAAKDTLTDEQKAKFFPKQETAEEKTTREAKEKSDANIAAGLNPDGTPKEAPKTEKIEASEKKDNVVISASEYKILKDQADKGAQAFADLEKAEVGAMTDKLVFSESNKGGNFLPKSKDNLRAFIEKLSKEQRTSFSTLMADIPKSITFKELGDGGKPEGANTAFAEVTAKVEEKVKASEGKLKFSDALKQVLSENKELNDRYIAETK